MHCLKYNTLIFDMYTVHGALGIHVYLKVVILTRMIGIFYYTFKKVIFKHSHFKRYQILNIA